MVATVELKMATLTANITHHSIKTGKPVYVVSREGGVMTLKGDRGLCLNDIPDKVLQDYRVSVVDIPELVSNGKADDSTLFEEIKLKIRTVH